MTSYPYISEHFTYNEMIGSQVAARKGIDNSPSADALYAYRLLCRRVMEPTRELFGGSPIIISSGYRCEKLNIAIGGSKKSQHKLGEANDFVILGVPLWYAFQTIYIHREYINFDQLIFEYGRWIHISYNEDCNRQEALVATRDTNRSLIFNRAKTRYTIYTG